MIWGDGATEGDDLTTSPPVRRHPNAGPRIPHRRTAVDGPRRRYGEQAVRPRPRTAGATAAADGFDELAALAVLVLRDGLARGGDPTATVVKVLTTLFLAGHADGTGAGVFAAGAGAGLVQDGPGAGDTDRVPGDGIRPGERVSALIGDPAALSVLVQRVLGIVRGTG